MRFMNQIKIQQFRLPDGNDKGQATTIIAFHISSYFCWKLQFGSRKLGFNKLLCQRTSAL